MNIMKVMNFVNSKKFKYAIFKSTRDHLIFEFFKLVLIENILAQIVTNG